MYQTADDIADEHGCELLPGANRKLCLAVQRRYSQGRPVDDARLNRCRTALRAAGFIRESEALS
jgi:hypothetical protein